jgi:predicted permease
LSERLAALPGVRAVSAASQFPPMGAFDTQFKLEHGQSQGSTLPTALITVATPSFSSAARAVAIRPDLQHRRSSGLPAVAIVNQTFVNRYLAGVDPLGQRMTIGSSDRQRPWVTTVGVVADFRNGAPTQPIRPEIYIPVRQQTVWNQLFVLVRGEGGASSLLPTVRQTVAALDAEQPIYAIQTMEEALATASFQQRISALLLSIFAGVALVLAAIGIYGVMSYTASARIQEMGVRLAIGAQPRDVKWLVFAQVLRLCVVGLTIGILVLIAGGRLLEELLFGVRAADPGTILIVALILSAVAVLAAWAPAARASRVDPIEALRYE